MTARTCQDLAELPGKASSGGHVYILLFDNGTVKVGSTTNPRARVRAHQLAAECFGLNITDCWVSRRFDGYLNAEGRLIAAAQSKSSGVSGREWFRGVDFADLVLEAPGLTYSNPGAAAVARRAAKRRVAGGQPAARRAADFSWSAERADPPMPDWLVTAMAEQATDEDRRDLREVWLFNRYLPARRSAQKATA